MHLATSSLIIWQCTAHLACCHVHRDFVAHDLALYLLARVACCHAHRDLVADDLAMYLLQYISIIATHLTTSSRMIA